MVTSSIDSGSVIDIGCGWGSFTQALHRKGYATTACDYVLEHVVATKIICPEATVYQADARDLSMLPADNFDFVCLKSVIEHIGDHALPVGGSGRNLPHQFRAIREAARIAKVGSHLFLSTGNFRFPFDGECDKWFFHWLPMEKRRAYMKACHFSSDNYWLLTWEELSFMFASSGLQVDTVQPGGRDVSPWRDRMIENLDKTLDARFDETLKDILVDLFANDPRFFPNWDVKLRKVSPRTRVMTDDLPLALRVLGGDSDDPTTRRLVLMDLLIRECGGSTKTLTSDKRQQLDALACLWAQILSD